MKRLILAILLHLGIGASVCADVTTVVREGPNPSYHNPGLGAAEVSIGGSYYFDDNAANGSFQIATGYSRLVRMIAGGDASTTITFYDDADGTCNSNQRTPTMTVASATLPDIREFGIEFNNGVCMLVGGGTGAEIGVVTLP